MIKTALAHALIAIAIQLALGQFFGYVAAGAVAVAFYLGRELSQHEYKLGIRRGWQWGESLPVKPWEPIIRGWSRDSALDIIAPVVAVAGLAYWLGV
ncbi:hypothetical protein FZZ93_02390 [Halomonas eurihalina]|uniref:Uncharacterized protein n=1 Tax=Halomonas eurihalina TaxID=42566 RepID=A0A5D9DFH1_HALER|nr:hypothetical protein [Halomonas eurihalina]MDR5857957.1 hypothetical protein [Halomonas eurihalina]TZG41531.1 hypothetical protein FZZ93_02390 [Halomonas eurihalina]